MGATGAGASQDAGTTKGRRRQVRRSAVLLISVAAALAQVHATQAQVPPATSSIFQARICQALLVVRADFGANDFVRQALAPFLARFGCTPTTTIPSNTTTSTHLDCPLPGGGIGPCPTTTVVTITPTTSPPFTFPTSSTSSTLPPCPSTTTTTIFMPSTTIPCQP